MYALALWLAIALSCQLTPEDMIAADRRWAFAEEEVDCISVAHVESGSEYVFFWALVQGEWTCLDHRWLSAEMAPVRAGDDWVMFWRDDAEDCYRLVRTKHWVESWTKSSPLEENNNRPWFARLLAPGLKKPK